MRQPDAERSQWIYATSGDEQLDALGTWIWDLTMDTVTCSDETAAIAGVGPGQLDGDIGSFAGLFTSQCRSAFRVAVTEGVQQAKPFRTWLELQRADGTVTLVRISGRPFRDPEGHTVWMVGTMSEAWPGEARATSLVATEPGVGLSDPAAAEAAAWSEPHDRRSAAAAYRHVSHLI